jgi:signal transduction histidine kinase
VYLAIVSLKLTNPLHGLYFTTGFTTVPFPHTVIELQTVHWVVTGLAYALTLVGFYILYEALSGSNLDTTALSTLVALTALPVVFDIASYASPALFVVNYEPVGVAAFAISVLYVVDDQFVPLPTFWRDRVIEDLDNAVVILDYRLVVRDHNSAAADVFPALDGAGGRPLDAVAPELARHVEADTETVSVERDGGDFHYLLNKTVLSTDSTVLGYAVTLSDVTVLEGHRRELQRQNEQFDDFAAAITHELRNTINIVKGSQEAIAERVGEDDPDIGSFHRQAMAALSRTEDVISDLSMIARYGQTIESVERCDLRLAAETAWNETDTDGMALTVEGESAVEADRTRLTELFRNAFLFAAAVGASAVTVEGDSPTLTISMDAGAGTPDRMRRAFTYGEAVPSAETGMALPNLETLARVHGWRVESDDTDDGGVRIRIETADGRLVEEL